jgi:hypothetical protein
MRVSQVAGPARAAWPDHQLLDISAVLRARKLPVEMSTSWWKGLGQVRPAAYQGACVPSRDRGGKSAVWRENSSKHLPVRAQNFDQPVEDPSKVSAGF